jgi:uncharacterized protein (DUF2236 family)
MRESGLDADSIARRINAERILILSWPRAILLQLAHPLVAAGVADHSSFRRGPLTAVRRLHETLHSMLRLTFGSQAEYDRTIETIRTIHTRVHGTLRDAVGIFPAGTRYSAEDPALVLWVHATLIESVLDLYGRIVAPLSTPERDDYCGEAAGVAVDLGARPGDVPRTWQTLTGYLRATYDSGHIAVGPDAREVARAVLAPPLSWSIWPLARLNRTVTLGLLPAGIREQYGHTWTSRDEVRFAERVDRLAAWRVRAPAALALWADARRRVR